MSNNEVKISSYRLNDLQRKEAFLDVLEATGVDSWEGYESAIEAYEAWLEEVTRVEE